MRRVLLSLVIVLSLPATASLHTHRPPVHRPKRPPVPAPIPPPTQTAQPRWVVVDRAGTTVGQAAALSRDGVATVLLEVGTETVAVHVTGTGWSAEGGGPLWYLAPDCTGDAYTPSHAAAALTAHAFGAYAPDEGLNDRNLYIADTAATPQDLVVYSMRPRTTDDTCLNVGGSAPTTLYPVRVYSTAMAAFSGPFSVRVIR